MMRDEIFTFESFISWRDLIGMGSLEDHKGFGALHPQFGWAIEQPLVIVCLY